MGFDFGHIMGNVVNLVDVMVVDFAGQNLFKTASNVMGQHLAVGKGIVRSGFHGRQVILTFRTVQRRTNELPVRQGKAVFGGHLLKPFDIVAANLVTETARSAMNLNDNPALKQADATGDGFVENSLDHIDLNEVVAGTQGPHLSFAALLGTWAHLGRIRPGQTSIFFSTLQVRFVGQTAPQCPGRTGFHQLIQLTGLQFDVAAFAHPAGTIDI